MKTITNRLISPEIFNSSLAEKAADLHLIYRNEAKCIEAFRKFKVRSGMHCERCNANDFLWLFYTNQFECKNCESLSGIKHGTILENLNLPVSYLFVAVHLLLKYNNEATVSRLQQVTGYSNAERLSALLENVKAGISQEHQALLLIYFIESLENDDVEYLI